MKGLLHAVAVSAHLGDGAQRHAIGASGVMEPPHLSGSRSYSQLLQALKRRGVSSLGLGAYGAGLVIGAP